MAPELTPALRPPRRRLPTLEVVSAPVSRFDAFRAQARFPALDGIRAISILAVIWHHTAGGFGGVPLSSNGFLGVDMFFVLSGFLIVSLILKERERTGAISLRRFYARRTLRIFPIYYLVLAAILVFVTVIRPESGMRDPFLSELPFHASYTTNWIQSTTFLAIAWSLATEEQFYLLWPPLEKFFARQVLPVLVGFLVVNQLLNFGLLDGLLESRLGLARGDYAILQVTFTPICLGVLLAHALARPGGFARLRSVFASRWSLWIVLVALIAVCNAPGDISGLPRLSIQLLMGMFLAGCVLDEQHPVARVLSRPWIRWIGAISYGMYLYHHFARHAAAYFLRETGLESPLLLFLLCSALTVAVSALSFRFIESPLTGWKHRRHA
ncbi:MAG TPA: acyltransferase [Planctomycetota bacterium]|nr:acyltransferase [Planctomycetota bacterium]